jgi:hypothetical protein
MTQKLPFLIFKKTQPTKPKISQIKIYLQETQESRLVLIFKANGQTLCFFKSNLQQILKIYFLCSSFSIKLYLMKIADDVFLFFVNLML